jgi:hypothetical protein
MDIFQQWLLLRMQEQFGSGTNPMDNEITFESIVALIKPIFEQENAPIDEADIRRNLDVLVTLGYLKTERDMYFLTFRAIVYSQASASLSQLAKEEFEQYVNSHWLKVVGIAVLIITLAAVVASVVTVNVLLK